MPTTYTNRVLTIFAVLWVAISAIYPRVPGSLFWIFDPKDVSFQHALKPGIDMVGGTSLTYELINTNAAQKSDKLAEDVATALKQRVDPQGVRNLIWRPQGATRLEIQMPLTRENADAGKLRDAYTAAREKLEATNIRVAGLIDDINKKTGPDRDGVVKQAAADSKKRADVLVKLVTLADKRHAAETAKDADALADVRVAAEPLEAELAATNLPVSSVEAALDLQGDARTARLKELRDAAADFPSRLAALNATVDSYDAVARIGGALNNADELKRLLRGSGVLSFHILANDVDTGTYQQWVQRLQTSGPRPQPGDTFRWFEWARGGEGSGVPYNGKSYALVYVDPQHSMVNADGQPAWKVESVQRTSDQNGGAAVAINFDTVGQRLFGDLTARFKRTPDRGYNLALVLDQRLVSAPTLPEHAIYGNVTISSGGGGGFSAAESAYLITTLSAGSLPAQLTDEPISEVTVGPQLGSDNLRAGLVSCGLGLVIVFVFLLGYYYLSGFVAFVAVLANLVLILGAMAIINATFTLPGVAGIVLSVAIAVDANVLIFERLREEQARGLGLKMALRNSYDRAFGAIFDGQVTTAISSLFLYIFGSEEVKGFGLTLLIGIVTSLFTALYVTKTIFGLMVDKGHIKDLSSLPRTFPKWNDLLTPKIDWVKWSWAFLAFSAVFIGGGLICFAVSLKNGTGLDIEFSGGTAVQVELKQPLDRPGVQALVEAENDKQPGVLVAPRVVAIGNDNQHFEISTPTTDTKSVTAAVMEAMGDKLNITKPSTFDHSADDASTVTTDGTIVAIETASTAVEGVSPDLLRSHIGGAAIVLNNLNPPVEAKALRERLGSRKDLEPVDSRPETLDVETFDGGKKAVIVVSDARYSYDNDPAKQQAWRNNLATPAWQIIKDAVTNPPRLTNVTSFNAQVAEEAKWNTAMALFFSIIGILAYIWVRFGNVKFGTATVAAAVHDAAFVVAAIGFSHYVGRIGFFENVLLIHPFRLDLTIVAAVLTVIGYSLNDTVVIFDRVRENRGKFGVLSRKTVNDSINQTFSRTLLTGGTSIGILLVMYLLGGEGIHGFTFVMLLGIIVGTYSSIAVASPLLLVGRSDEAKAAALPPVTPAAAG